MCSPGVVNSSKFGDGVINVKLFEGVLTAYIGYYQARYKPYDTSYGPYVDIGTDSSPESLDSYARILAPIGAGSNVVVSTFDEVTRKLIVIAQRL